jgi:hypothetical protein
MNVDFRKGFIITKTGSKVACTWASAPHGTLTLSDAPPHDLIQLDDLDITTSSVITTVDLSGLDQEHANTLIRNILQGGYLEKPGVQGKGDAVLFILVNEAIQVLDAVAEDLAKEDHQSGET